MYDCYSSLHPALTARRATTSASVSASLPGGKKSQRIVTNRPRRAEPTTTHHYHCHLSPGLTPTISAIPTCLEVGAVQRGAFSSFVLSNCLISPFARLSSTSCIDIIYRTSPSSASIFVFGAYINGCHIKNWSLLLNGEHQRIALQLYRRHVNATSISRKRYPLSPSSLPKT